MAELCAFVVILVGWAVGECVLAPIDRPASGTLASATGLGLLAAHVAGVTEHLITPRASPVALAAGAVLAVAGVALRLWAIATLGNGFLSRLDAPRLVTRGPYRWLRHPSELGLAVAALGTALVLASRVAVMISIALVPFAILRCRREDAALARDHAGAYAHWRARR